MKHLQCPKCKNTLGWDSTSLNKMAYGRGILKCKHCKWKEEPPFCKNWVDSKKIDHPEDKEWFEEQERRQDIYLFHLCNFVNSRSDDEAYIEDDKVKLENTWNPTILEFEYIQEVLNHYKYNIRDFLFYIQEESQ